MGADDVLSGPFKIEWIGDRTQIDPDDDNVDIFVKFESGSKYVATFFTLKNLATLLSRYRRTGECANGLYFWNSDMIVVERLTDEVVAATVSDLMVSGEFAAAFSEC
jgi:hypothetical protein